MPRLIRGKHCPHCGAELPEPKPRSCPECAGSIQQRYLRWGCISSAPPVLVFAVSAWALARLFT